MALDDTEAKRTIWARTAAQHLVDGVLTAIERYPAAVCRGSMNERMHPFGPSHTASVNSSNWRKKNDGVLLGRDDHHGILVATRPSTEERLIYIVAYLIT
jgi:hypothetical protein